MVGNGSFPANNRACEDLFIRNNEMQWNNDILVHQPVEQLSIISTLLFLLSLVIGVLYLHHVVLNLIRSGLVFLFGQVTKERCYKIKNIIIIVVVINIYTTAKDKSCSMKHFKQHLPGYNQTKKSGPLSYMIIYLERSFEGFLLCAIPVLVAARFVRHIQLTCKTAAEWDTAHPPRLRKYLWEPSICTIYFLLSNTGWKLHVLWND